MDTHVMSASTNLPDVPSGRWGLGVAGLVGVAHLDQSDERRDGAHQAHQPAGEPPRPQEARRHPVDGVAEVGRASEGGENLRSHLPAELSVTAEGEGAATFQETLTALQPNQTGSTCHRRLPLAHVPSPFSSATSKLEGI